MSFPRLGGRHPHILFIDPRKIIRILTAHKGRDLGNRIIAFHEETFGLFHPGHIDIIDKGSAGQAFEHLAEVIGIQAYLLGCLFNGHFIRTVGFHSPDQLLKALPVGKISCSTLFRKLPRHKAARHQREEKVKLGFDHELVSWGFYG